MKNISLIVATAVSMMLSSCGMGTTGTTSGTTTGAAGAGALGSVISAVTNGQVLGNVLQSVLGLDKMTKADLIGTWTYSQPGCAFTSKEMLAQAGGEAMAQAIKDKMLPTFQSVGINSTSTKITFKQDGTFTSTIAGKNFSGKYTFDEANYKVNLQGLLLNINCYAKKNSNGIALLFEASKLLTVIQTMTALSGNSTAQTIGDLSKNYDGLRIGFDYKK
ncbi:DUF4923 family protein [Prevotella sp. E9-3]|uniref:DUF4923 family protein n=1 Tax=Prevotella sp. E9-3 TaxID=2913621 RepID=UPI001EDB34C6|nr:DUF4923 family protein [Prevotella sp. E9-3]UKK48269.1 DUF4923 family protein [Prevotella sp. E9-3]